jgi:hypothetical protein
VALAGLAVVVAVWPVSSPLTRVAIEEITNGMTRAEVHATLGPPGDYRTGPTTEIRVAPRKGPTPEWWKIDDAQIWVYYDQSGRVEDTLRNFTYRPEPKPLDNLLWRAKRQWHRWFP